MNQFIKAPMLMMNYCSWLFISVLVQKAGAPLGLSTWSRAVSGASVAETSGLEFELFERLSFFLRVGYKIQKEGNHEKKKTPQTQAPDRLIDWRG